MKIGDQILIEIDEWVFKIELANNFNREDYFKDYPELVLHEKMNLYDVTKNVKCDGCDSLVQIGENLTQWGMCEKSAIRNYLYSHEPLINSVSYKVNREFKKIEDFLNQ